MFNYLSSILNSAELVAQAGGSAEVISALRKMPFDDFALFLITLPRDDYPNISKVLPKMAADEVQRSWTGNCGVDLLKQTNNFTRIVEHNYNKITCKSLSDSQILDFGCGYGRIMRNMYYHVNSDMLYGCDPWDKSINLCREAGIIGHLAQSEYLPDDLPFDNTFDLIYSFSVFTHLSERSTGKCLSVLRDHIAPDGLLVITIRPVEYWAVDPQINGSEVAGLVSRHENEGFSFRPHPNREAVDGDITYGDTSMTLQYIETHFPAWKLNRVERTLDDAWQLILFMTPQ